MEKIFSLRNPDKGSRDSQINTAVVAQSVKAFVSHAEGWLFQSQQLQT